jgi:photosynthetic reaction center L subunit
MAEVWEVDVLPQSRSSRVIGGRTLQEVESDFRKPGNTLFGAVFRGYDPLDFWIGPFYFGMFGFTGIIGIILGAAFYLNDVIFNGPYTYLQNFVSGKVDPPPSGVGLSLVGPGAPGFAWQMTVLFASIAFISWMLREIDISRKLKMGYHVPISFGVLVSAWLTLQVIRPILIGRWSEGFVLGVLPHLDWIVNFGYRYINFYYNPFHCLGVTGLFTSTLVLGMHGSAILSASQIREGDALDRLHAFWYDIVGYSIGELGIHKLATIAAAGTVLVSNLCIIFSGWPVMDWASFWNFWDVLPWWSSV